jgi:cobyrinic acid a,c-diamide synthase
VADEMKARFNRENSIMVNENAVRGYLNTLFDRGIYEHSDLQRAIELATEKGKRFAVALNKNFSFSYCDLLEGKQYNGEYENGTVIVTEIID